MSLHPEDLSRNFFCPLCHSNHFLLVTVRSSKTGTPVVIDGLYKCAGCSLVFSDPEAFTQVMQDRIVDRAIYRERRPMREYPPDAETVRKPRGES